MNARDLEASALICPMCSDDRDQPSRGAEAPGDGRELGSLFAQLHDELRAAAGRILGKLAPGHTLQPTALVNEAFLKLHGAGGANWADDSHLIAVAAMAMRQVLVDHERRKAASIRPPSELALPLDAVVLGYEAKGLNIVELNEALQELASFDPQMAKIVDCRFFLGISMKELASRFGFSRRTLDRRWDATRAWLQGKLE